MSLNIQTTRGRLLASTMICGVLAIGFAAPAFAADDSTEVTEVVVTGTRIQSPGVTSSSPISSVSGVEIAQRQVPEAEQYLRTLPSVVPGDGSNVNNGTAGASTLNLRGLGSSRNLVMIDGKRVTPYNINGIVDLSVIPVALVDRIDIITGGASAVYGSDAISGAANFIMKRNFEGVDLTASSSRTTMGDGRVNAYSATIGANSPDGKGNSVLSLNLSTRDGVKFGDRDYGRVAVGTTNGANLTGTPAPSPANCSAPNTFGDTAAGSGTTTPAVIDFGYNGYNDIQFRNDGSLGAQCNSFNFNPYNYYQTPQKKYGGMASVHYEVNPSADVYAKALFSHTDVTQQVAPSGVFFNGFVVPLNNPFFTAATRTALINSYETARLGGATLADLGVTDVNGNGQVDAGDKVQTYIARRTDELGPRSTEITADFFQFDLGVRGDVPFLEGWNYDASIQYGRSDRTQVNRGYSNVTNIAYALDATNTTTCNGNHPGCVPINLFGPAGSITPAMAAYASATALQQQTFEQSIAVASVSGPLNFLQSPWATAPVSMALGGEYRQESGAFTPDECLKTPPVSCLGGAGGTSQPVSGRLSAKEVFVEAIVPVIADKPLFKDLNFELGYRYADNNPAGIARSYKVGVNWTIFDGFRFRAMKQQATRAPNIGELYAPISTGLANSNPDPCSIANTGAGNTQSPTLTAACVATGVPLANVYTVGNISAGQVNIFAGTNPAQLPQSEKGNTVTVGFVWEPSFLGDQIKRPLISLDYYDINVDNYIGTYNANEILAGCYTAGITAFCNKIHRLAGSLKPAGAGIDEYTTNLLNAHAEGLELNAGFGLDFESLIDKPWGKLDFNLAVNYYLSNDSQSSTTVPVTDCLGYYGSTCGNPTFKVRWNQRTSYSVGRLRVGYLWRHQDKVAIEPTQASKVFSAFRHIKAYDYLDLDGSFALTDNVKFNVTVLNVFDKDPPIIGNSTATTAAGGGNTLPSAYDVIGRVVTVGVNLRF